MSLHPYITFNGNAKEAIDYYAQIFGSVATVSTFAEMPSDPAFQMPEDAQDRIMHAIIPVAGSQIMVSDNLPDDDYEPGNNMGIAIVTDNHEDARKWFNALAEEGNVEMDLEETFWSPAFGMVIDKFDITWMISTE